MKNEEFTKKREQKQKSPPQLSVRMISTITYIR